MSLKRHAARRDANEPAIRARFARHGWHTEQLSEAGMPDLITFPPARTISDAMRAARYPIPTLVDVKTPTGKVTSAQEEKWRALAEKGIPVYVVCTAEDVDALVRGELAAWAPAHQCRLNGCETGELCGVGGRRKQAPRSGYTAPRSKPVDAAKEADETFAAPPRICANRLCERPTHGRASFCAEHFP